MSIYLMNFTARNVASEHTDAVRIVPQSISIIVILVGQFLKTACPVKSKVEYDTRPSIAPRRNACIGDLSMKAG